MKLIKTIHENFKSEEKQVSELVENIEEIISLMDNSTKSSIGLKNKLFKEMEDVEYEQQEKNLPKENDIIIDVKKDKLVPFVVIRTRPKIEGKNPKSGDISKFESEFLSVAATSSNPRVKKAAKKLGAKYADRKIWVYGDISKKNIDI